MPEVPVFTLASPEPATVVGPAAVIVTIVAVLDLLPALAALHEFLRYQIAEHKTGDPLAP